MVSTVPHFALVTVDGDTRGAHEFDGVEWASGSVIARDGDEPDLRVVDRSVIGRAVDRDRANIRDADDAGRS